MVTKRRGDRMATRGRREERRRDVDERERRRGDGVLTRGRGEERRQDGDEKERRTLYQ